MFLKKYTTPADSKNKYYFTAILYIVASIAQGPWIYILYKNFDQVKRWATLPVFGWVIIFLLLGMTISMPVLFSIGLKLFLQIKKATMLIMSYDQKRTQKSVNMLLSIGILVDLLFSWLIIQSNNPDRSFIVFLVAFFGGRLLLVNLMAINLYFGVNKNKNTNLVKT